MVAALAGDSGTNFATIKSAGDAALTATSGDQVAADGAATLIQNIRGNASTTYTKTLAAFNTASTTSTNAVLADLYAAVLVNNSEADAGLAVAIKQSSVPDATLLGVADDAQRVFNNSNALSPALSMVDAVVSHIKSEAVAGSIEDLFDYVGHQIVLNSALTPDIAKAAVVIDPNNAHFIAHSVAFNSPNTVAGLVNSMFAYAQITNTTPLGVPSLASPTGAFTPGKTFPGPTKGTIIDQPAAAAAITAGLTAGIFEANLDHGLPGANTQAALVNTITAAVAASIGQNGVNLKGPTAGHVFNNPGDTALGFQQMIISGAGTVVSTQQTVGAAGAITGYVAQVTNANDTSINNITKAVLQSAVTGSARPYAMQIAQAAGQALRWVGGVTVVDTIGGAGTPAFDIATAIVAGTGGASWGTLAQIEAAVAFGIDQANQGTIGAGALGLNAKGLNPGTGTLTIKALGNNPSDFYQVHSLTGTPVTDIFNL
jgi:hypothetical protein